MHLEVETDGWLGHRLLEAYMLPVLGLTGEVEFQIVLSVQ